MSLKLVANKTITQYKIDPTFTRKILKIERLYSLKNAPDRMNIWGWTSQK